jgi:hypothetical protein
MRRALLTQALGDFEPVYGVSPLKVLGHQPRFVALDGSDAMPFDWQRLQGGDFFYRFLDVVLSKCILARFKRLLHCIGTKGFGNRQ